jgi:tRNA threonylcarbamoyladenosine dehydratase
VVDSYQARFDGIRRLFGGEGQERLRRGHVCIIGLGYPGRRGSVCNSADAGADLGLDCESGFGTAAFVTGTFGLVAASRIVQSLAGHAPG